MRYCTLSTPYISRVKSASSRRVTGRAKPDCAPGIWPTLASFLNPGPTHQATRLMLFLAPWLFSLRGPGPGRILPQQSFELKKEDNKIQFTNIACRFLLWITNGSVVSQQTSFYGKG